MNRTNLDFDGETLNSILYTHSVILLSPLYSMLHIVLVFLPEQYGSISSEYSTNLRGALMQDHMSYS